MYTQGGYQNLLGNNRILVSNAAGPAQCGVEFVCKETHPKKLTLRWLASPIPSESFAK